MSSPLSRSVRGPRRRGAATRGRLLALAALPLVVLGACGGDDDDAPDATVLVDENFPGDALDATCARLEGASGDDREQIVADLLTELSALGDPQLAVNTLQQAVVDACPDWADAVDAVVGSGS